MAKSPLGLSGIPRVKGLQVKGFLLSPNDEFVFIADTLKQWQRARQSLANFVEDEGHREELLRDLYLLRDWVALEAFDMDHPSRLILRLGFHTWR